MTDIRNLTGTALDETVLGQLAALRIEVFRAFPYLYDGSLGYERGYLDRFRDSQGAVLIGAFDGATAVGAATGSPLRDHASDFAKPFAQQGIDLDEVFYFAESVLLPAYRGQGIGHRFFDEREAHARALGFKTAAFCAVIRPDDHPLRPSDARDVHPFWRARGYAPQDGLIASLSWKDIDAPHSSPKQLQFWTRAL